MYDAGQLQRLTVVHLKARCKELGILGVSKVNKANLVRRILDATASAPITSAATSTHPGPVSSQNQSSQGNEAAASGEPTSTALNGGFPSAKQVAPQNKTATEESGPSEVTAATKEMDVSTSPPPTAPESGKKKRESRVRTKPTAAANETTTDNKRRKTVHLSAASVSPSLTHQQQDSLSPIDSRSTVISTAKTVRDTRTSCPTLLQTAQLTVASSTSSSSTAPLSSIAPSLTYTSSSGSRPPPAPSVKPPSLLSAKTAISAAKFTPLRKISSLKPPSSNIVSPAKATFPPTPLTTTDSSPNGTVENRVAHIKSHFVNRLCVRLNATRNPPVITAPFPAPFPWPSGWSASLAFPGIHPHVYARSNDIFSVALRFWIARAHALFQLGSAQDWSTQAGGMGLLGPDLSTWPPVVSAEQVTSDVFLIATTSPNQFHHEPAPKTASSPATADNEDTRYLVLAKTGDIIASSRTWSSGALAPESQSPHIASCIVRPDWDTFITASIKSGVPDGGHSPLMEKVKTKDTHNFPSGINRAWASRVVDAPNSAILMEVAERAVLTSCMLNSFSGDKLDALQMEAWWLSKTPAPRSVKPSVELYLPESHQVLSVHIPPSPFHPGLAVVHRQSGRSEYVLRETGHVVGDEDGVVELWQGLLGCDYKGNEKDSLEFWKGWERRARGE